MNKDNFTSSKKKGKKKKASNIADIAFTTEHSPW
jgi:hypothetical protein